MRRVPPSQVTMGVARSMSKKSRYRENMDAGMSKTAVASTKFTKSGFRIFTRNAMEMPHRSSICPIET